MNPYTLIAPIAGVLTAAGIAMLIWWIRGLERAADRARTRRAGYCRQTAKASFATTLPYAIGLT